MVSMHATRSGRRMPGLAARIAGGLVRPGEWFAYQGHPGRRLMLRLLARAEKVGEFRNAEAATDGYGFFAEARARPSERRHYAATREG